jgi:hypothetical protein
MNKNILAMGGSLPVHALARDLLPAAKTKGKTGEQNSRN